MTKNTQTPIAPEKRKSGIYMTAEEVRRQALKEDIKCHIQDLFLYIIFGILGTFPFWGWILFGWLWENFH